MDFALILWHATLPPAVGFHLRVTFYDGSRHIEKHGAKHSPLQTFQLSLRGIPPPYHLEGLNDNVWQLFDRKIMPFGERAGTYSEVFFVDHVVQR